MTEPTPTPTTLEVLQSRYIPSCAGIVDEITAVGSVTGTVIDLITEYILEIAGDQLEEQRVEIVAAAIDLTEWAINQAEAQFNLTISDPIRLMSLSFIESVTNRIIDAALALLP